MLTGLPEQVMDRAMEQTSIIFNKGKDISEVKKKSRTLK